tara:strand:+ start:3158 stop:5803 length:2646 start_codon:yes stop_codon:yes gene_type:complete
MVLPLAALLGLAVGGGAVTGYAGEVQRKKVKAEEDAEFLRRLQLQTGESKKLAEFQSGLRMTESEAESEAERKKLALSLNLPPDATYAEIATAQSRKILLDAYNLKNVQEAANVGLPMTATSGAITTKKQEAQEQKIETEFDYKKKLEKYKKEIENTNKSILEAEAFTHTFEVPGTGIRQFSLNANEQLVGKTVLKKFNLPNLDYLASEKKLDGKEQLRAGINAFNMNVEDAEQLIMQGSQQTRNILLNRLQEQLYAYKTEHLIKQKPITLEMGGPQTIETTVYSLARNFQGLAESPMFGPIIAAMDKDIHDAESVETYIEQLLNLPIIAQKKKTTKTFSNGELGSQKKVEFEGYTFKDEDGPAITYDCTPVGAGSKEACNTFRDIIKTNKKNISQDMFDQRMNYILYKSPINKTNFGAKNVFLEGNPEGDGYPMLDFMQELKAKGINLNPLQEVSQVTASKTLDKPTYESIKDSFTSSVAQRGSYYQSIITAHADANLYDFTYFIDLSQAFVSDSSFMTFGDLNSIYDNAGLISTANVSNKYHSLLKVRSLGIPYIETVPDGDIENVANTMPKFAHYAAKHKLKADPNATALTGAFLNVYKDYFKVLPEQLKEFFKTAFIGDGNEGEFISSFINVFTRNIGAEGKEGFRFKDVDVTSKELTQIRKESFKHIYNDKGKLIRKEKFKDNAEFLKYERMAYDRNQERLADIQKRITDGVDIQGARRDLLKFMMAYELASYLQGGTGGRTISDQDVENMLRAIGADNWTSTAAMVGGTLELLTNLEADIDIYTAITSTTDPSRVMAGIYARDRFKPLFRPDKAGNRDIINKIFFKVTEEVDGGNNQEEIIEQQQEIYTIDSEGNVIKKDDPPPQNIINILGNVG